MAKDINIEQYLSSGILEEYVLGTLPEAEAEEVNQLINKHSELQSAVEEIEGALLAYGDQFSGDGPKDDVLQKALNQIEEEEKTIVAEIEDAPENKELKTISFNYWTYWGVAASIFLLFSIGLNFFLYQNWRNVNSQLLAMEVEKEQFTDVNNQYKARLDVSESFFTHLQDVESKPVRLAGLDQAPDSKVLLSWNEKTNETLLINYDLPELSAADQYQLWAIIDGKPVDAGVIKKGAKTQFMKSFSGQAVQFAITVEPKGGSKTPTLSKMYAAGAVS